MNNPVAYRHVDHVAPSKNVVDKCVYVDSVKVAPLLQHAHKTDSVAAPTSAVTAINVLRVPKMEPQWPMLSYVAANKETAEVHAVRV